jgi:hypothetical protein
LQTNGRVIVPRQYFQRKVNTDGGLMHILRRSSWTQHLNIIMYLVSSRKDIVDISESCRWRRGKTRFTHLTAWWLKFFHSDFLQRQGLCTLYLSVKWDCIISKEASFAQFF